VGDVAAPVRLRDVSPETEAAVHDHFLEALMTLNMPDSIYPGNMPRGYGQYLAYVDGSRSRDADVVRSMFAGARILTLTVLGGNAVADGCDCEPGDLGGASAVAWARRRIQAGAFRPVIYASASRIASEVLAEMKAQGVARWQVRLLSAHYGAGEHICGPGVARCGYPSADGTQWTSTYPGAGGAAIDMSLLADDFFGAPTPPATVNWTENLMQQLPTLKQGATGTFVRTVQFQCGERGHAVKVDGSFGSLTLAAVKAVQAAGKVAQDGVCGPVTWGVLFGVQ
jgi:peptidoglycan hydrolase-like protein with peptidoglycan-binding domain